MNKEQQRIAIAEACGWTRYPEKDSAFGHAYWAQFKDNHFQQDTSEIGGALPDYLNDLNAMHEAYLQVIQGKDLDQAFAWHLYDIINRECYDKTGHKFDDIVSPSEVMHHTINASAEQRAEAFLFTINNYERC